MPGSAGTGATRRSTKASSALFVMNMRSRHGCLRVAALMGAVAALAMSLTTADMRGPGTTLDATRSSSGNGVLDERSETIVIMIPARAGSDRLPLKNARMLGDKPVIQHTIELALALKERGLVDDVVVSSDAPFMRHVADRCGVKFYLRDEALAGDTVKADDVVYDFMMTQGTYDWLVWLNPVSPVAPLEEVAEIMRHLVATPEIDTLITVREEYRHALHEGVPLNFNPADKGSKTQDLRPVQIAVYSVLAWRYSSFTAAYQETGGGYFSGTVDYYPVNADSSVVLKYEDDLRLAEDVHLGRRRRARRRVLGDIGPGDDIDAVPPVQRLSLYDPVAWEHVAERWGISSDATRPEPPHVEICSTENLKRELGLPTVVDGFHDVDAHAEAPPQDRYEMPVTATPAFGGAVHLDGVQFAGEMPDMFSNIAHPQMPVHAGEGPGPLKRFPSGAHAREHSQLFQVRSKLTIPAWLNKRDVAEQLFGRDLEDGVLDTLTEHFHHGEYDLATLHVQEGRPTGSAGNVALASCALVGSGDSLVGRGLADDIELHDSVWRIGLDPVAGYEEMVGARTNVRVVDMDTIDLLLENEDEPHDSENADLKGVWVFVPRSDSDLTLFATVLERAAEYTRVPFPLTPERVVVVNPEFVEHVDRAWTLRPEQEERTASLDAIALQFALRACSDQVTLFGFGEDDEVALHGLEEPKERQATTYYDAFVAAPRGEDLGEREVRWFLHDAGIIVDRSRDGAGHT